MDSEIWKLIWTIATSVCLAGVAGISAITRKCIKDFRSEHKILLESQRNMLKANIVQMYETSLRHGYISNIELDVINRMADSYFDLNGNHYVHTLIKRLNNLPIKETLSFKD